MLYFCAEGDNVHDAFLIADVVQRYLHHGMLISESLGFLCVHVQMMLGHILTMNIFYMPYL
jgi:hypothetical protein